MMTKDEKLAMAKAGLAKAMRETPYPPTSIGRPRIYALTDSRRDALITAAQFVLSNGGIPEEELKDLREALQVLTA